MVAKYLFNLCPLTNPTASVIRSLRSLYSIGIAKVGLIVFRQRDDPAGCHFIFAV